MLAGGIVLICCWRLSTTASDLQLRSILSIVRSKLSTCNFRKSQGKTHMLYGASLISMLSEQFHFKKMETIAVKAQDEIVTGTRSVIAHADWLNDHESADKQYDYAKLQNFSDSEDPELLWRYGRACHCFYTYSDAAIEARAAAVWDGLSAVEKAVLIDSQNANAFVVRSGMHANNNTQSFDIWPPISWLTII